MQRIKSSMEEHSLVVEQGQQPASTPKVPIFEKFKTASTTEKSLACRDIPKRHIILDPWLREGSLGYIYGLRGSGKTWFAWKMAISISKGENFGPWACKSPLKVLYVDGEMALEAMQERVRLLNSEPTDNLMLLSHENLANTSDLILNLCKEDQQDALLSYCSEEKIKVVFLDNLSCLCFGMKENEADSWEKVLGWLLMFRRAGIAVVIIHHANRDGNDMRGTSRREDAAFWVIKISQTHELSMPDKGTAFTTTFTKNRDDNGQPAKSIDWWFMPQGRKLTVGFRETNTKALVYDLIANGVDSNKDIAASLGLSLPRVSQITNKLLDDKLIKKFGVKYTIN